MKLPRTLLTGVAILAALWLVGCAVGETRAFQLEDKSLLELESGAQLSSVDGRNAAGNRRILDPGFHVIGVRYMRSDHYGSEALLEFEAVAGERYVLLTRLERNRWSPVIVDALGRIVSVPAQEAY